MESTAARYRLMTGQDMTYMPAAQGTAHRSATTGDEHLTRHTVMLNDLSKRLDDYFSLPTFGGKN